MRPVYVRTEEHTRGHVLAVMLAYLIRRELSQAWQGLNVTVEEGLAQLVDPFSDWCGRDSGPGEICAEATGRDKTKYASAKNTEMLSDKVRTRLFQQHRAARFSDIA